MFNVSILGVNFSNSAWQGQSALQQWMLSQVPSVGLVNAHDLNDLFLSSGSNWTHPCKIHSTTFFLGGGLGFLAGVKSLTDLASHLSYFSATAALDGLFPETLGAWICFVKPPGTTTGSTLNAFNLSLTESEIRQRKLTQLSSLHTKCKTTNNRINPLFCQAPCNLALFFHLSTADAHLLGQCTLVCDLYGGLRLP